MNSSKRNAAQGWTEVRGLAVLAVVALAAAAVWVGTPVGLVMLVAAVAVTSVWPKPESWPPTVTGEPSAASKTAAAVRTWGDLAVRPSRWFGFRPVDTEAWAAAPGAGPAVGPITGGPWRPSRLSAWWSLAIAVAAAAGLWWCAAAAERAVGQAAGGWLPVEVTRGQAGVGALASAAAVFAAAQVTAAWRRASRGPLPEPSVQVTWEAAGALADQDRVIEAAGAAVGLSTVLAAAAGGLSVAGVAAVDPAAMWAVRLALAAWALFAVVFSARYTSWWLGPFRVWVEANADWEARWESLQKFNVQPPHFVVERRLPVEDPTVIEAVFAVPGGGSFGAYGPFAAQLATALGAEWCVVERMPAADGNNRGIAGTAQEGGFTVAWPAQRVGPSPHTQVGVDVDLLRLAARRAGADAFTAAKLVSKTGGPVLISAEQMTVPGSPGLWRTRWRLPDGIVGDDLYAKRKVLRESFGVSWLEVGVEAGAAPGGGDVAVVAYGADPAHVEFPGETSGRPSRARRDIERLGWDGLWLTLPKFGLDAPGYAGPVEVGGTVTGARFTVPSGRTVGDYRAYTAAVSSALAADLCIVDPVDVDGHAGFEVRWAAGLGEAPHLNRALDEPTRAFAVAARLKEAFEAFKLGSPTVTAVAELAAEDSDGGLCQATVRVARDVTFDQVAAKAPAVADDLGVRWLRVGDSPAGDGVVVVFGDPPGEIDLADGVDDLWLIGLDWAATFRACKIVGVDGRAPHLTSRSVNDQGVATMTFTAAAGVSVETIAKAVPEIRATAGLGYVEVSRIDGQPGEFRVVAGVVDPLDRAYLFVDWADEILTDPEPGRPTIDWMVGVGADGAPMTYRWDAELPHLLLAGGSGMGKSSVINSMLLQIAHNCSPNDVQFRLLEPKNELQTFADLAHVTHFVDMQTPGVDSHYDAAARLLGDTVVEMERRYRLFNEHPAEIKKLSEARLAAAQEGPPAGGGRHPLDMPYIIVVIEECADFFAKPPPAMADYREDHGKVIFKASLLARKARAAGIYMVVATQYPTNENLPQTLKQQCRRLGLGTSNQLASMVVIDEPGLEEIQVPGRGKMTWGKTYRGFRALYLRAPDEAHPDEPDDRAGILAGLPKVPGRRFGPNGAVETERPVPTAPTGIWAAADEF